jgi:hypothetical protein
VDTSPLCPDPTPDGEESCHDRRHRIGVKSFWAEVGMTYGEANKRTQMKWLARRNPPESTEDVE